MTREEIYRALDGEREYQDMVWGGRNHDQVHEIEAWIMYMEHYIGLAKQALSTELYVTANPTALDNLRKVVALGIACFENFGCPQRVLEAHPNMYRHDV